MLRIISIVLALLAAAPAQAQKCKDYLGEFIKEFTYQRDDLRHKEIIWMERGEKFVPSVQIAELFNKGAAVEVAWYLDTFELPREYKVGIMFYDALQPLRIGYAGPVFDGRGFLTDDHRQGYAYQKVPFESVVFFDVFLVDKDECIREILEYGSKQNGNGYDTAEAVRNIDPYHIDEYNELTWFVHDSCGLPFNEVMAAWLQQSDPVIEADAIAHDRSTKQWSAGISEEYAPEVRGKRRHGINLAFFPGRTSPQVILNGPSIDLELPIYMEGKRTPRRIIMVCRQNGTIDLRYVVGGDVQVFENVPVRDHK